MKILCILDELNTFVELGGSPSIPLPSLTSVFQNISCILCNKSTNIFNTVCNAIIYFENVHKSARECPMTYEEISLGVLQHMGRKS